jgi:hypothetical protein
LFLNLHFHRLFLDGVYVVGADGTVERFRWVRAPTTTELSELTHTLAERVGGFGQRQGLLECDGEQSFLAEEAVEEGSMDPLLAHSITYRMAVGPQAGRKRCSPCKPWRPATSRSMTRWARWPGSRWADENQPKRTRFMTMVISCFCSARVGKKRRYRRW